MLQIKKKAKLIKLSYSLKFLFRENKQKKLYFLKKKLSQTITLRSPKHFNIGKYKTYNINYKTLLLDVYKNNFFHLNLFFIENTNTFFVLSKRILTTPVLHVNSIKLRISTKFKIKWLEI